MIYSFELEKFLGDLLPVRDELLLEMEEQALRETIPVVTPPVGNFLAWLVKVKSAERILELGTAIGYSTLWLAKGLAPGKGYITTIDLNVDRANRAMEYFQRAGVAEKIQVLKGDARRILPDLTEPYDLIFVDAAKGEYIDYLTLLLPLVAKDGILVIDNVLFRGWVVPGAKYEPKYERMVSHLREFLKRLNELPDFQTSVLPLGDGLALSVRNSL